MATIVGIEAEGGAVLAGDRLRTEDGTVQSENADHVFDFGEVGAAVVGEAGAIDEFRRKLEAEVRSYETDRGKPMGIDRLATIASNLGNEAIEAIVAARNDAGRARVRGIEAGGGLVMDERLAFGSGAQFAFGVLDDGDTDLDLDDAAALTREAIQTAADRDTGTGEEIDTYRLESDA